MGYVAWLTSEHMTVVGNYKSWIGLAGTNKRSGIPETETLSRSTLLWQPIGQNLQGPASREPKFELEPSSTMGRNY